MHLSYAFGAPVLLMSSNVIFLVGAAWLPLGIRAADRWVRLGRRWGILELAIVLAMQTLGGDPESAYLLGVSAAGYAVLGGARSATSVARGRIAERCGPGTKRRLPRRALPVAIAVWYAMTVGLAVLLPKIGRAPGTGIRALLFRGDGIAGIGAGVGVLAVVCILASPRTRRARYAPSRFRFRGWPSLPFWRSCSPRLKLCLAGSSSGKPGELLLVMMFSRSAWSRSAWLKWYGPMCSVSSLANSLPGPELPLPGTRPLLWVSSLYLGGMIFVLGISALTFRPRRAVKTWLSAMVAIGLLGSLGQYGSPVWMTRALATSMNSPAWHGLLRELGPLDAPDTPAVREDGRPRDGDGSVYWWMTILLPGFRQFRFPSKLLVFAVLALAALAGWKWDELRPRLSPGPVVLTAILFGSSVILLAMLYGMRSTILAGLAARDLSTGLGPFDREHAFGAMVRSSLHASAVFGLGLAAISVLKIRPRLGNAALLLAITAVDLGLANARQIVSVPQSCFDDRSRVQEIIEQAEQEHPSAGPFRVHRMMTWLPLGWKYLRSDDRPSELVRWEVDTLQPKFGINRGISYTYSRGIGEINDYASFFRSFPCPVADPAVARSLGVPAGESIAYSLAGRSTSGIPAISSCRRMPASGLIPAVVRAIHRAKRCALPIPRDVPWSRRENRVQEVDRQLRLPGTEEQRRVSPGVDRSSGHVTPTLRGVDDEDRLAALKRTTQRSGVGHEPRSRPFNPREVVLVDPDQVGEVASLLRGGQPSALESVRVNYPSRRESSWSRRSSRRASWCSAMSTIPAGS